MARKPENKNAEGHQSQVLQRSHMRLALQNAFSVEHGVIIRNLGQSSVDTGAEREGRPQWVSSETDSECQQSSQRGCEKREKDSVGVQWVRCQWV